MDTPRVMVRFRNSEGLDAISAHNEVFRLNGKVAWGLWLKAFEDEQDISRRLNAIGAGLKSIYIADTSSKSHPIIYVASVAQVITNVGAVSGKLVPDYYRSRVAEISIWFVLAGEIMSVDATDSIFPVLGVPTIYFLHYKNRVMTNIAPQREYVRIGAADRRHILHLTDIHLGEDHGFRSLEQKNRSDVGNKQTLIQVLKKDLQRLGVEKSIAAIIISGDIVTRGGWDQKYTKEKLGSEVARNFLGELSVAVDVPLELFCMVPGNHDVIRDSRSAESVNDLLLEYGHENGFRSLREDVCGVYKLSPLNYVLRLHVGEHKLMIGLLNSSYLNDQVAFNEYGFVGDDAEQVFEILGRAADYSKILVLHHHLLPVYEREMLAKGDQISLTLDAANIMRRAQEVGVEIVLHGHQHAAKIMDFASWSAAMETSFRCMDRRIRVVAGGSAGVAASRLPEGETNTYGLLKIDGAALDFRLRRIFPSDRLGEDW